MTRQNAMDNPIELYQGFHGTPRNLFWVFGQGADWYWVKISPISNPPHLPEGPFESSEAAYINAMQCD